MMINEKKEYGEIKKRLENTFGKKDDRYYVYALCDENNKVFYIGKGTGGRVLAHEEEIKAEKAEIDKIDNQEERISRLDEFNKKQKKIDELSGNVKKVIIKYGLTNEEAFQAESALINMLNYMGEDLCNIANGHASAKEKDSNATEKTKARELSNFIEECALEEITIDEIEESKVKEAIFISFRTLAPHCNDIRDLYWDAVRGEWRMSEKEANNVKYIFAMSDSIIKAVFEVKPGNVKNILSDDNHEMPKRPNAKTIKRETEYHLAQRIAEIYVKYQDNGNAIEAILEDKTCLDLWNVAFMAKKSGVSEAEVPESEKKANLKKWLNRRYFTERVKDSENELSKYANKILKVKNNSNEYVDYMSPRGSVRYGKSLL